MRGRDARRHGVTLVELLVALVVAGAVILGARAIAERLGDATLAIGRAAEESDHAANAERLLRGVVSGIEVGTSAARAFGGDEREVRFDSWCMAAGGWLEHCAVTLTLRRAGGDTRLLLDTTPGGTVDLGRIAAADVQFRYLSDARLAGTWSRQWGTGITAPLAIAIVSARDTMVLRIGERG